MMSPSCVNFLGAGLSCATVKGVLVFVLDSYGEGDIFQTTVPNICLYVKAKVVELQQVLSATVHNLYCDVTMGAMASQITSFTMVYSAVHLGTDQRKHQNSASLAFVQGIHRWSVNSPQRWPVTRKMFAFDDVIMMREQVHNECNKTARESQMKISNAASQTWNNFLWYINHINEWLF